MMKKKIILALLLVLVLAAALILWFCGSDAGKMAAAAWKMNKLQSYSVDMDVDAEVNISFFGKKLPLELQIGTAGDVNTNPLKSRMDLSFELFGVEISVLRYTVQEDADVTICVSPDGGGVWTRETAEAPLREKLGLKSVAGLWKLASDFEKIGTETVRESEAVVYSGTLQGAELKAALEASGALGNLLTALSLPTGSIDLENCGSIPITFAIDQKSGMITKFTVDLTEQAAAMLPALLDSSVSAYAAKLGFDGADLGTLGFSMEPSRVFAAVELYNFDAAAAVEIPDDALAADA